MLPSYQSYVLNFQFCWSLPCSKSKWLFVEIDLVLVRLKVWWNKPNYEIISSIWLCWTYFTPKCKIIDLWVKNWPIKAASQAWHFLPPAGWECWFYGTTVLQRRKWFPVVSTIHFQEKVNINFKRSYKTTTARK